MNGIKPVWANEIDKYCAITFTANHKKTELLTYEKLEEIGIESVVFEKNELGKYDLEEEQPIE